MNGVYGLKPTPRVFLFLLLFVIFVLNPKFLDIVPVKGFYPSNPEDSYPFEMNVAGPICRYVEDIPLVYKVS